MKNVIIIISFVFLFTACQTTNDSNTNASSPPPLESAANDSVDFEPSKDDFPAKYIIYSTEPDKREKDTEKLSVYWVNNDTAFGIDSNNNDVRILVVNTKNATVSRLQTDLPDKQIREMKVIGEALILSTPSGFYSVSLDGSIKEIFMYAKEAEQYALPLEYLQSETLRYFPVISEDFRYISYFYLRTSDNDLEGLPAGQWDMVLLDLQDKKKTVLLTEKWSSSQGEDENEVVGKYPISFSPDTRYLIYNNAQLFLYPLDSFGGSIDLTTVNTVLVEQNKFQVNQIINKEKALIFEQGPPSFQIYCIYIYDFVANKYSLCRQTEFHKDLLQSGPLFYYSDSNSTLIVNSDTREYSDLSSLQSDLPNANLQDINNDGSLIGISFDDEDHYVFTILDLCALPIKIDTKKR